MVDIRGYPLFLWGFMPGVFFFVCFRLKLQFYDATHIFMYNSKWAIGDVGSEEVP